MVIFRDAHDYLSNLTPSPYESDMQVRLIGLGTTDRTELELQ